MTQDANLTDFRNRHRGETVVVCGCGKSALDIKHPDRLITIGVNDVGRIFNPTYLVVVNPRDQFTADRFRFVETSQAKAVFTQLDLDIAHRRVIRFRLGLPGGTDLSDSDTLPYTGNSPYVAACLAAYMGAARIGLIGVDFTDHHFFFDSGSHPLSSRLTRVDREYAVLAAALADRGVELVNLSPISRLMSLPRVDCGAFCDIAESSRTLTRKNSVTHSEHGDVAGPEPKAVDSLQQGAGRNGLNVLHVARTNCAGAIWNLHNLLNKYTSVRSRVVTASPVTNGRIYPKDVLLSEIGKVGRLLEETDLIHFHNRIDGQSPEMQRFREIVQRKPAVLQFHSEPAALQRQFPGRDLKTRRDILTLVVAQKQARLFPNAIPVPNAIDIHAPLLKPSQRQRNGLVRVVYAPSDTSDYPDCREICRGKGYTQTLRVLTDLEAKGAIKAVVRTNVPWRELMELRHTSDVLIDECVTGGYHLTSLEGLSQGLVTVAFLDEQTRRLLCELTGSSASEIPWVSTPIDHLGETLAQLAEDHAALNAYRDRARLWMERYWNPEVMAGHYLKAYDRAIREYPSARPEMTYSSRTVPVPDERQPILAGQKQLNTKTQTPSLSESTGGSRGVGAYYTITGVSNPKRSEDFPQTVRLGPDLLSRGGSLAGQPCHILGNGPSVTDFDLSLLSSRAVIGVNASVLLHEALGRAPDYYCVSDRRFLQDEDARKLVDAATHSVRVFAGYCHGFIADGDIHYVRICGGDGISEDIFDGFYHCCSVVLFAAQLALWLGCGDLYLHGCEFDYKNGRFCRTQDSRPYDRGIYGRVTTNVRALSERLARRGTVLYVVGPSRLVGDFGARPVPGVRLVSPLQLNKAIDHAPESCLPERSGSGDTPSVSRGAGFADRT